MQTWRYRSAGGATLRYGALDVCYTRVDVEVSRYSGALEPRRKRIDVEVRRSFGDALQACRHGSMEV